MIQMLLALVLQESDWKKENFAGPVPEEILRSQQGHLELVRLLGSRRLRHGAWVNHVSYVPGSSRILTVGSDGTRTAAELFRKCLATGVTGFPEYPSAAAELKRLDGK